KGRILDLSYAAAKMLGIDIAGTAWVKVEALGYRVNGTNTYKAASSYETGSFTVQIGSFRDPRNAERLSGEMKTLFGFSEIHMTTVNGATFYRVYAGKYSSLKDAESAEREFCDHGYPGSFAVALE
ncbi:MAG TPA: SPOR domain-containing protein, partial [Nitrospirota bacterium]